MTKRVTLVVAAFGVIGCFVVLLGPSVAKEIGVFLAGRRIGVVVTGGTKGGCTLPPATFEENELLGVWAAGNEQQNDRLTITQGGLYRQKIRIETPPYSYESERQHWWVEYRGNGLPLLHLEGMRLCVYSLSPDCESPPARVDQWYDFCSDTIIESRGEGVLIIAGVRSDFEQPLRGIELLPLTKDPDTGGWPYRLEE